MAYNIDFIKRAVEYKQEGHTFKQLRETFHILPETYYLWKKKLENGYYNEPKPKRERRRKIDKEKLRQTVQQRPGVYLRELAEQFGCTSQAVSLMLRKLNITLNKDLYLQRKTGTAVREVCG